MTQKMFKAFKEVIETADTKDPIWWAGYHWIDLTPKQANTVCGILEGRGFDRNDKGYIVLPSGLGIKEV